MTGRVAQESPDQKQKEPARDAQAGVEKGEQRAESRDQSSREMLDTLKEILTVQIQIRDFLKIAAVNSAGSNDVTLGSAD